MRDSQHTVVTAKAVLAQNLKRARLAAKLSQREVSIAVGANEMQVSRWERGASEPRVTTLYRLARIFRVPVDILFVHDHPMLPRDSHA